MTLSKLIKRLQDFLKENPEAEKLDVVNEDLEDVENIEILLDDDDENPIVLLN